MQETDRCKGGKRKSKSVKYMGSRRSEGRRADKERRQHRSAMSVRQEVADRGSTLQRRADKEVAEESGRCTMDKGTGECTNTKGGTRSNCIRCNNGSERQNAR